MQIDELKHELKRLKELARAQEHGEHVEIEGQSFNSYDHSDSESVIEIDMNQYFKLHTINLSPPKNDDI